MNPAGDVYLGERPPVEDVERLRDALDEPGRRADVEARMRALSAAAPGALEAELGAAQARAHEALQTEVAKAREREQRRAR